MSMERRLKDPLVLALIASTALSAQAGDLPILWPIMVDKVLPKDRAECVVPNLTRQFAISQEDGYVDQSCVVIDSLIITEAGARAQFLSARFTPLEIGQRNSSRLIYVFWQQEMNCRTMDSRERYNSNLITTVPRPINDASYAADWVRGDYSKEDREWSAWEPISFMSASRTWLCDQWRASQTKRP
jgi:hypothetical protein